MLNHLDYYRLPWNLTDNSISWLEPTVKCNLSCDGCYRKNENKHKTLDEIRQEMDVFKKFRKADGVSIAGGDPLLHPDIIEIVRMVKEYGMKPILNTNGHALTTDMLKELKKAGVYGFTFHVDSKQGRPGWKDADEHQLNELRYQYARMLADAGGISCSFNSTVYEDTVQYIPGLLEWAKKNIDIVQVMVFIIYRAFRNENFDYFAGPEKIHTDLLVYNEAKKERIDITANEVVDEIRKSYNDFDCCAYLNGSNDPASFKWLLSGRLGTRDKIFGYMGAKSMEIIQTFHHLLFSKYLAYSLPNMTSKGKSMLLLSLFDKKMRKIARNFLINPINIFKKLHYQTVLIIQPIDILEDGRQNMCDGCPDITVWNGKLVWSCRLDEQENFGFNLQSYPKNLFEDRNN